MQKNIASQKVLVFAWDTANNTAKSGDAANITAKISKDCGAAASTDDTNPTELDATNFPGIYYFNLTQTETNADMILIQAVSSTSRVAILPVIIFTTIDLKTEYSEPAQDSPAATTTGVVRLNYLYKAWRNKKIQTSTTFKLYDDSGVTVDQKATVSDDGSDFTFGEIITGP